MKLGTIGTVGAIAMLVGWPTLAQTNEPAGTPSAQASIAYEIVVKTNHVQTGYWLRDVNGQEYDTRFSVLWTNISGKCLSATKDGARVQIYFTNIEYGHYSGGYVNGLQSVGAYSGGGGGGKYEISRTVEPTKQIWLNNYRIGRMDMPVSAMAMHTGSTNANGRAMELWDCGTPHTEIVVSTNRVALKRQKPSF